MYNYPFLNGTKRNIKISQECKVMSAAQQQQLPLTPLSFLSTSAISSDINVKRVLILENTAYDNKTGKERAPSPEKTPPKRRYKTAISTWGLTAQDIDHNNQIVQLNEIAHQYATWGRVARSHCNDGEHNQLTRQNIVAGLKTKLSSYKQQDLNKEIYDKDAFINILQLADLLKESGLHCHYCHCAVYLLYEYVRENKQWTLDRIDNSQGHNFGNVEIACLDCNLRRRCKKKEDFYIDKNLTITKLDCEDVENSLEVQQIH